jgi:8-oxo-dGTP pyrophosphatase MutT (NUDIX family)
MIRKAMLSAEDVRTSLARRTAKVLPSTAATPYAGVAAVLRFAGEEAEVLLIKRSEREGDPWSGQMALPGGRRSAGDADLVGTAVRETREEVGLELAADELVGRLDDMQAISRGELTDLIIVPHVFVVDREVALEPARGEVDVALWAPLGPMLRGETLTAIPYVRNGITIELPGFRVASYVVWGLTYRMLDLLFDAIRG